VEIGSISGRIAPGASAPGAPHRSGRPRQVHLAWGPRHRLDAYVWLVTLVGVSIIVSLIVHDLRTPGPWWPSRDLTGFIVLGAFTLASELVPLRIERKGDVEEVTTSTTFAFATMLLWGTAPAVFVLTAASVVADIVRRKAARKILFNVGQYSIVTASAGGLFALLGGTHTTDVAHVPVFVASAAVFFAGNTLLTGIVVSLSEETSVLTHLRRDLRFNAGVAATLLAMSPVVALVTQESVVLVLLLVLPVAAVQLAAERSLERAALIEQLRGSLAHLTELNRAKDEFLAVVSHELRTPLTSVRGNISTVLNLGDGLSKADVRSCLEAADRQGERLQRQIEQLLLVANLEAGRERIAPTQRVSIPELVRCIVADMDPVLQAHRVVLHVDEDVEPVVTDEGSVCHIVTNLLENAAKYSPPETEIDIDIHRQDGGVLLTVRDRGCGIPHEYRDRIFERFYQVDSSATRAVGGTGLGLYIAASCAQDIGGGVWLERSDAQGSEFRVSIPSLERLPGAGAEPQSAEPEGVRLVGRAEGPAAIATPTIA
jgi:signal transduction histidine kinase